MATVGHLVLPHPKNVEPAAEEEEVVRAPVAPKVQAPPQGKRKGWVPRSLADFGDAHDPSEFGYDTASGWCTDELHSWFGLDEDETTAAKQTYDFLRRLSLLPAPS